MSHFAARPAYSCTDGHLKKLNAKVGRGTKGSTKYDEPLEGTASSNDPDDDAPYPSATQRGGIMSGKLMASILKERATRKAVKAAERDQELLDLFAAPAAAAPPETQVASSVKVPLQSPALAKMRSLALDLRSLPTLDLSGGKKATKSVVAKGGGGKEKKKKKKGSQNDKGSRQMKPTGAGFISAADADTIKRWISYSLPVAQSISESLSPFSYPSSGSSPSLSLEGSHDFCFSLITVWLQSGPLRFSKVGDFLRFSKKVRSHVGFTATPPSFTLSTPRAPKSFGQRQVESVLSVAGNALNSLSALEGWTQAQKDAIARFLKAVQQAVDAWAPGGGKQKHSKVKGEGGGGAEVEGGRDSTTDDDTDDDDDDDDDDENDSDSGEGESPFAAVEVEGGEIAATENDSEDEK